MFQDEDQTTTPQTEKNTSSASSDMEALQAEIQSLQEKLQDMTVVGQRALADLQNFKRRSEEEKNSFISFATGDFFMGISPAIDNLYRALELPKKDETWIAGTEQTIKQLMDLLEKKGIKTIPTVGQPYDPRQHEALLTAPGEKDIILEELEKGYTLNGKVIKPARVKVGNGE